MCLAMPAEVLELLEDQRALVNLGGIRKEISIALVEDLQVGDFVIIHVGYALTRLDQAEAQKTLALFSALLAEGGA